MCVATKDGLVDIAGNCQLYAGKEETPQPSPTKAVWPARVLGRNFRSNKRSWSFSTEPNLKNIKEGPAASGRGRVLSFKPQVRDGTKTSNISREKVRSWIGSRYQRAHEQHQGSEWTKEARPTTVPRDLSKLQRHRVRPGCLLECAHCPAPFSRATEIEHRNFETSLTTSPACRCTRHKGIFATAVANKCRGSPTGRVGESVGPKKFVLNVEYGMPKVECREKTSRREEGLYNDLRECRL